VNLPVKYEEMSSPREAIAAISSAVGVFAFVGFFLDVFDIALLFLVRRLPTRDEAIVFAPGIVPNLENDGTEPAAGPTDGAKLLRLIVLLVDDVRLIEYVLRLFQADAMFSLDAPALLFVELEAHRCI
jgi:hypothetical protein